MGLYYQVKDCALVPACSLTVAQLTAAISVKQDELSYAGTSSYSHTFSLDAAATCIVLSPTTFSVTHDYASKSAITATLSQVTSGSYVDLKVDVAKLGVIPDETVITFSLNLGLDYYGAMASKAVLQLTIKCYRTSLTWAGSITSPI